MKKGLLFLVFIVFFYPNFSFSQCIEAAFSTECGEASGSYKTIGDPDPEGTQRDWSSSDLWKRLKGNPENKFPIPPRSAIDNKIYIEISEGHRVKLDGAFSVSTAGNSLTLVVCGELEVGDIFEIPLVITGDLLSADCDFTLTGSLKRGNLTDVNGVEYNPGWPDFTGYDAVLRKQSGLYIVGFEVALYNLDLNSYYPSTIPLKYYSSASEGSFDGDFSYSFNLSQLEADMGLKDLSCSDFGTKFVLGVRAFADFSLAGGAYTRPGLGIDKYYPSTFDPDLKFLEDKNELRNHLNIIVCPTGTLIMKSLNVHQHANIIVDGTFIIDEITGGVGNSSNNCIATTDPNNPGTIVNTSGGMPAISIPGFIYGGTSSNCIGGTPILPVDLLSFAPDIKPDRIELKWTTGTEINNDYFTLERSRDMYGWEVLGFVPGAGNSSVPLSYSFSDLRPLDGLAYYRLKQTDFDGAFKYYGPIAAHYDLGLDGLDFKVMKSFSNWVIAVPNDGFYQVEVYNLQGHRLHSERVENTLSIPAPEGAVVIRVTDGFERSASRVVM